MNALAQTLRHLGPVRLATMAAVAIGLVGFFIFFTSRLTSPALTLFYSDLAVSDSAQIVNRLESLNIPFELRGDGSQIFVPEDQVLRLRMNMASEGLPNGGSVGYELFDQSGGLGSTSFVQQLNQVRALEGELARTITSLARIQSARVHLVLPKREVFSRDRQEPTASIVIKLNGGSLGASQVLAIQHLVSTAVPALNPNRISIIDSRGNLLARGGDSDETNLSALNTDEMRASFEARLARTVERLLERSVGAGSVHAEVSAEINFDRLTTNEEIYDPDGQVVRSTQSVEEGESTTDTAQSQEGISVANNLPNSGAGDETESRSASASNRAEETVNFEISRTIKTLVRETGVVQRLSVAVLINGTFDAEETYIPRSEEELAQFVALVRSAIGYEEARGDSVEVVNLRFTVPEVEFEELAEAGLFGFSKQDIFRIVEMLVLGVVAILIILMVVRPVVNRILEAAPSGNANQPGGQNLLTHSGAQPGPPQIAADGTAPSNGIEGADNPQMQLPPAQAESALDEMINLSSVEGKVRSSSINRVAEIVDNHPDETVSILRGWMHQES
ncbi:MAG: flagellar basal-body MS-ring/collar protein FliF [Alphaproteobacteria bacterium]